MGRRIKSFAAGPFEISPQQRSLSSEKTYQFLASSSSHFASYETARSQFSTDDFWASVRSVKQDQGKREQNPQEKANFFSLVTFWWLNWIINTGYKRPLEDKDLWALRREDQASYIVPRLKKKWLEQQRKCRRLKAKETEEKEGNNEDNDCKETDRLLADEGDRQKKKRGKKTKERNPSLAKTLWSGLFGVDFAKAVMFQLLNDLLVFIQPQLLRLLVEYTDREHKSDLFGEWKEWKGYLYAGAMLVTACIQSLAFGQFVYLMNTIGMRINTALIGLVYEKALMVKFKSHGESTTGELVNLMSVDAQRVMRVMTFINNLWSSPFRIGVALYLLYNTLGISVLAGIGVVLLALPLFGVFSSRMFALQGEQMTKKDGRLKLINEVLKGMKVLKLYAWEQSFMREIKQTRNKELRILRNMGFWFSGLLFLFNTAPTLIFIVTFIVYVFTGQQLIASKAFYALSLINVMSVPLLAFPDIISALIMAKVSLKRLQDFLNSEELDPSNVQKIKFSPSAVAIENASFAWSVKDAPVLRQISLRIPSGSLIAIVGQVGSGKSTLLSAILGETEKLQGRVSVQGSVAYVSQQAWIQHNTVRENILFGKAYDSTRYEQVIDSCALRPDLDILQAGDSTEIGERGINLSGGQKQRVSLARAVYFNADIYLLDDPLSAVDTHVGKHIFDKVVGPRGILKNKTRLLVTHGVHFLPQVDQIIVIEDGRISECGTYSELLANSGAFAEFLHTYASENHSPNSSGQLERSISRDAARTSTSANVDAVKDLQKPDEEEKGKMIDKEISETGRVKFSVLLSYLKSMGICITVATIIFALLMEACKVSTRFWLAYWIIETNTTNDPRNFYVGVYGGITLGQVLFSVLTFTLIVVGAQRASRRLHNKLLENIMRAPMSFFDTTPLGRIVNRFSNDMDVIDEGLYQIWSLFLSVLLDLFGIIVAIGYTTPLFLLVLPLLGALYFYFQKVFVASSRQLKRIESVRRSPIYSHFLETINGASTIRAFSQQQRFIRDNYHRTDENQVAYYLSIASNSWLPVRLHFIGGFLTLFAALFAVVSRDSLFSALVGMSLTFSLETTEVLNMLVLMTSLLETELVSVERVKEYSVIDTEVEWIKPDNRPPDDWPNTGGVVIEEFDLRYREGLPLVLRQINCDIKPGEKIGVVGRTGAGKSSLTLALFRILERAGGRILIDGIDIATIGLQDLRSRLTIIPQEPVLFCGSIRFNLDPFNKHSDDELWTVMEVSHLKSFVSGLNDGLQHKITEGGENLSVGQRQLLCLARALLRDSKVLVLDEATAAVDLETDDLIQQTIRREFADRTVFTIAHRLNTIMDYDRILVLDNGVIFEFDTPEKLLKQESLFMKMAKAANLA